MCEYCGNKSGFMDKLGNCASCGAPIGKVAHYTEKQLSQVEFDAQTKIQLQQMLIQQETMQQLKYNPHIDDFS